MSKIKIVNRETRNLLFFAIVVSINICSPVYAEDHQPFVTTAQRQQLWFIAETRLKETINHQVRYWMPISVPATVDTREYQLNEKLEVLFQEGYLTRTGRTIEISSPGYAMVPAYEYDLSEKGKAIYDSDLGFAISKLNFIRLEKLTWPVKNDIRHAEGEFRYRYAEVLEWIWAPAFDHYLDSVQMRDNSPEGYEASFNMKFDNDQWIIDMVDF